MLNKVKWLLGPVFILCLFGSVALAQQEKGGGYSNTSAMQADWYQKSYAFVVGINSYSHGWGRLSAGVSDAKKVAATLRERGFTVFELYDAQATSSQIVTELRRAVRKTQNGDRFLFFYSGHGFTEKSAWDGSETGYLVPVEGRDNDPSSYIPMKQIRDEIVNHCRAKHTLLILDSCFSGCLLMRSNIYDGSLADYLRKRGIYGIAAGMADQPAIDGLFTNVLIEALSGNADNNNDGYVTFKEIGMYTEQNVRARNQYQTPDYGTILGAGQFVFAQRQDTSVAPLPIAVEPVSPPPVKKPPKQKTTTPASLIVHTVPWVEVYIDGEQVGISPYSDTNVSIGKHDLRLVNREKGIDVTHEIRLASGQEMRIADVRDISGNNVEPIAAKRIIAPLSAPAITGTGHLIVNTQPWVNVHIDGTLIGPTPIKRGLPIGKHTVRLVNTDAGIDIEHEIMIKTNGDTRIGPLPQQVKGE